MSQISNFFQNNINNIFLKSKSRFELNYLFEGRNSFQNQVTLTEDKCFKGRINQIIDGVPKNSLLDILFYSSRNDYFDPSDLFDRDDNLVGNLDFISTIDDLLKCQKKYDIAIICTHLHAEHEVAWLVKNRQQAKLIIFWTWDNHHQDLYNLSVNSLADIIIPAHSESWRYMKSPHQIMFKPVPLPTAQWSRKFMNESLTLSLTKERYNALSGGFVLWPGSGRDNLLHELENSDIETSFNLMNPNNRDRYFKQNDKDRSMQWTDFKTSLCLPFKNDLSLRVFDSLFTGQIPLVPHDLQALDNIIDKKTQEKLPILRFDRGSVESIREAHKLAIRYFDSGGSKSLLNRHFYAAKNHHISVRIKQIVRQVNLLKNRQYYTILFDDWGCGILAS